ncbi:MAG: Gfo/Idh/MocA family oxidoreductase [Proteobacteria bacterium]|nr:Gfo/Idh/MocA family oxidoreductase [Pseudomonadota bacterium]MBI3496711.1 Gfo/Idh/MocA family oxidoreductase [Pseudomonadota bacterium]
MLRVGIVGCGLVAQCIHLPTLRELRDRLIVTAICDVSRSVLDAIGSEWAIPTRLEDYRDLIAREDVDIVLVANPHVFHAETAMAAMRKGKHVLIEKPMCMTVVEADALIKVEEETGVVAQVGYNRRYAPNLAAAAEVVRALPGIRLARVHDVLGRNAIIVPQVTKVITPSDASPIATQKLGDITAAKVIEAIGPASALLQNVYMGLVGLSSHDLSAMRAVLGFPQRVLFATARGDDGRSLAAAFDYGTYTCLFSSDIDLIPRFDANMEVYSASKVVRVEFNTPFVKSIPATLTITDIDTHGMARTSSSFSFRDSFLLEWIALHETVSTGRRPNTSIADARQDLLLFRDMIDHMRTNGSS